MGWQLTRANFPWVYFNKNLTSSTHKVYKLFYHANSIQLQTANLHNFSLNLARFRPYTVNKEKKEKMFKNTINFINK